MGDRLRHELAEALVDTLQIERLAEVAGGLEEQPRRLDLAGPLVPHRRIIAPPLQHLTVPAPLPILLLPSRHSPGGQSILS